MSNLFWAFWPFPRRRNFIPNLKDWETFISIIPVNVRKAEESRAKSFSKHLFVYFIQGEKTHLIKIGQTRNNPYKRLDALQSYSPDKLRLLKVIYAEADYEHQLHKRFASNRGHGEWFYPSQRLLKLIETLEGITDFREPDDPQARTPQLPKRNLT